MNYVSEGTVVAGEFERIQLQKQIEHVTQDDLGLSYSQILASLCAEMGVFGRLPEALSATDVKPEHLGNQPNTLFTTEEGLVPIDNLVSIAWKNWRGSIPIKPHAFGFNPPDPKAAYFNGVELQRTSDSNTEGDPVWHVGNNFGSEMFTSPRLLLGASKWPPSFLVGKVLIPDRTKTTQEYWHHDEGGKLAIKEALRKGTLTRKQIAPGEVVLTHPSTIIEEALPDDEEFHQYSMRIFQRVNVSRSGAILGTIPFI